MIDNAAVKFQHTMERLKSATDHTEEDLRQFLEAYSRPLKKERQPLMGEEMQLTRTLAPRLTLLAMHHAVGISLPPLILTYTGQRSRAQVHQLMKI